MNSDSSELHSANSSRASRNVSSATTHPFTATAAREEAFLQQLNNSDEEDVVRDVKDISLKDVSLLRLDGCRVRRTYSSSQASPSPAASITPTTTVSEQDAQGLNRASLRHGASRSPQNAALETSQAILENMAADTAASVRRTPEAVRLSPAGGSLAAWTRMTPMSGGTAPLTNTDAAAHRSGILSGGRFVPPGDASAPSANAMIRRQASFFSSSATHTEVPGSQPTDYLVPQITMSGASFGEPTLSQHTDSSLPGLPDPQADSTTTRAAHSVSEMMTALETAPGNGVRRLHNTPKKLPHPGETHDANHDLQQLFAKLDTEVLTRPNRLNALDDDEEDEMNTVLYRLKGGTAATTKRQPTRPSELPLPPTPDILADKDDPSTTQQTPLVPFQTWRFPNLGSKKRDSLMSPHSSVQTPAHTCTHTQARRASLRNTHTDPNGVSLMSPVDWQGSHQDTDERSARPWSRSSSPSSVQPTVTPQHRKDTISPQLVRRVFDRHRSGSGPEAAASTSQRGPRRSVTFPDPLSHEPLVSKSLSHAYHRAFEMVCAAYERGLRRAPQQLAQPAAKTVVSARASAIASGFAADFAAPSAPAREALGGVGGGGRLRGSPSLSTSLLRSSGYYSFGKRISLSHYNRQTIGEVPPFLGSMSNLHVGMGTSAGARERSVEVSMSLPTMQHRPACRLPEATLSRIKSRPLLQTTVFLRYNMASLPRPTPSVSSSDLGSRPQRSITETVAAAASTTDGGFNASRTRSSWVADSSPHGSSSGSHSTTAPPGAADASSSVIGKASNSSRITLLEVDALTEACEAGACAAPSGYTAGAVEVSPAASTGLRRALTEVQQLQRHVHTIDDVEREVDNENGDLVVHVGMLLMGWLEVVSLLGCGSFGQVFLCKDLRNGDGHFVHPAEIDGEDFAYWNCCHAYLPFGDCDNPPTHDPLVAVKVVKSIPLLENQSVLEAEMLVLIGAQTAEGSSEEAMPGDGQAESSERASANGLMHDPPEPDPRCQFVTKVLADGVCYGHHCIVMERYGANLYEYVERNDHNGLPMYQIRSVGQQLFSALTLLHDRCHIIHADIKPENMLLTMDSCRSNVALSRPADESGLGHGSASSSLPKPSAPSSTALEATPMEKSLLHLGKTATSPAASVVQTANGVVTEKMHMLAPQPVRVQALNHPSRASPSPAASMSAVHATVGAGERKQSTDGEAGAGAAAAAAAVAATSRLQVKLIDFSSSCYDGGPFYTYIQSRYYRAPEVIVGGRYGSGIDSWSAGCLLAELLLGIPLLPGCNDHHQLTLIQETIGPLPPSVLQGGSQTMQFYDYTEEAGAATNEEEEETQGDAGGAAGPAREPGFRLVDREEFFKRSQAEPMEYRRFFTHKTLPELVRHCPLSLEERRMSNGLPPYALSGDHAAKDVAQPVPNQATRAEIMKQRFHLFDLLRGLLHPDPAHRLTASQALQHPFFSTEWAYMRANGLC